MFYLKAYKEAHISSPERKNGQLHMVCLRMESGKFELLDTFNVRAEEDNGFLQWAGPHAKYSRETNMTRSLGFGGQGKKLMLTERIKGVASFKAKHISAEPPQGLGARNDSSRREQPGRDS